MSATAFGSRRSRPLIMRAAINAMSDLERRESAWRYWLARASQETGNVEAARALHEVLAAENNFYGVLAAEELGVSLSPNWHGFKPSRAEIDAVMQRPAIGRALAFYRLDMKTEGLREWQYGIRNMDDQQLLAAAEAARSANVPDRAINTAERTLMVHDFAQRFPTPHRSELALQARAQGLDEAWVYGLIRQESRFMADAKSISHGRSSISYACWIRGARYHRTGLRVSLRITISLDSERIRLIASAASEFTDLISYFSKDAGASWPRRSYAVL